MEDYMDCLTDAEFKDVLALNRKYGYGLSTGKLLQLTDLFEKASEENDIKTQGKIFARLEDANFHYENGFLAKGDFDGLRRQLNEEKDRLLLRPYPKREEGKDYPFSLKSVSKVITGNNSVMVTYSVDGNEAQAFFPVPKEKVFGALVSDAGRDEVVKDAVALFGESDLGLGEKSDVTKENPVVRSLYDFVKYRTGMGMGGFQIDDAVKEELAQCSDGKEVSDTLDDLLEKGVLDYDSDTKNCVGNYLLVESFYEPDGRAEEKRKWREVSKDDEFVYEKEYPVGKVVLHPVPATEFTYSAVLETVGDDGKVKKENIGKSVLPMVMQWSDSYCAHKHELGKEEEKKTPKPKKEKSARDEIPQELKSLVVAVSRNIMDNLRYHRMEKDDTGNYIPVSTGTFVQMAKDRIASYRKGRKSIITLASWECQPFEIRPLYRKATLDAAKENRVMLNADVVRVAVAEATGKNKLWFTSHRLYPDSVTVDEKKVLRVELLGTPKGERQYLVLPEKWTKKTKTGEYYVSCPATAILEMETKQRAGGRREHVTAFEIEGRLDLLKNKDHIRPHYNKEQDGR